MKELLTQLPTELGDVKSKIRVGFITYDTTVHFYNIKVSLIKIKNTNVEITNTVIQYNVFHIILNKYVLYTHYFV